MTKTIPEGQLSQLSVFIAATMGLWFPKERRRDLERGINAASRELGIGDGKSCIEWLSVSSPTKSQVEILASHLTVGETYFFRDKRLFKTLEESILPELIQLRRNSGKYLRIWSAGCSSGEEPYSIAILLSKMLPNPADWNITILGTDINTQLLHKAAGGLYRPWSFRDIRQGIKEEFFIKKENDHFEIFSRIRQMVAFSYLNLIEDTYPSLGNNTNALDIVFCRNVLMYFVPELAAKVVAKLHRSLADGGLLIVSPTEAANPIFSQFSTIRVPGAILFKKESPRGKSSPSRSPLGSSPLKKSDSTFKYAFDPVPVAAPVLKPAEVPASPPPEVHDVPVEAQASTLEGENRKILYQEASSLYEAGRYPEAVKKAEKLLAQNQSDAHTLALLARIYANWGKLDRALEWCTKAIASEKLHAGSYYLMSTILQELGRTEDTIASLKRTLYLDPEFIMAYVALGNISRKSGKHEEAVKYFKKALALLSSRRPEDELPESEGINTARLMDIIKKIQQAETGR